VGAGAKEIAGPLEGRVQINPAPSSCQAQPLIAQGRGADTEFPLSVEFKNTASILVEARVNARWSLDFVHIALGWRFRILAPVCLPSGPPSTSEWCRQARANAKRAQPPCAIVWETPA
jgi:hypothetical protein